MKHYLCLLSGLFLLSLTGCVTRSISNSDYRGGWYGRGSMYKGELSELDILGTTAAAGASEAAIATAFENQKALRLVRGEKVLLIQSGAMMPDPAMLDAAGKYLDCAPFSGVPPEAKDNLATSIRLRAAQGGYPYLICYWGILESGRQEHEGSAIAWVPFIGGMIPDSKELMRISLKAIVLDVRTGSWKMATYQSDSLSRQSAHYTRENTDQKMVNELKRRGYEELIRNCLK